MLRSLDCATCNKRDEIVLRRAKLKRVTRSTWAVDSDVGFVGCCSPEDAAVDHCSSGQVTGVALTILCRA